MGDVQKIIENLNDTKLKIIAIRAALLDCNKTISSRMILNDQIMQIDEQIKILLKKND